MDISITTHIELIQTYLILSSIHFITLLFTKQTEKTIFVEHLMFCSILLTATQLLSLNMFWLCIIVTSPPLLLQCLIRKQMRNRWADNH